jgi:glycosyltransferase involved in cell wall biosynthesis
MTARNLLFISPVMPAPSGQGLAMRAGTMLEALAAEYDVYLLVIPIVGTAPGRGSDRWASQWCAQVAVHPVADRVDPLYRLIARIRDARKRADASVRYPRPLLCRFATSGAVASAVQMFRDISFREVHVFRLYMAPFAAPYLAAGPVCRLDLDDHESRTRRGLATLYAAAGDERGASIERAEAVKYARLERDELPRFHRVYVCSDDDRRALARHLGARRVVVIPNAVSIPRSVAARRRGPAFTLLFVGTLGYYPNEDAAIFFCREVLPRIRGAVERPVRALIVGSNPPEKVRALAQDHDVTVTGTVPDLGPYYAGADAVVVPLRAGGGTRIKVLEAFSYRRPVVSTTVGAQGIEATPGTHLLIGDTPRAFAAHCVRLTRSPELGRSLAARAFQFVTTHHTPAHIRELLRRDHREA